MAPEGHPRSRFGVQKGDPPPPNQWRTATFVLKSFCQNTWLRLQRPPHPFKHPKPRGGVLGWTPPPEPSLQDHLHSKFYKICQVVWISKGQIALDHNAQVTSITNCALMVKAGPRDPCSWWRTHTRNVNKRNCCLHHLESLFKIYQIESQSRRVQVCPWMI